MRRAALVADIGGVPFEWVRTSYWVSRDRRLALLWAPRPSTWTLYWTSVGVGRSSEWDVDDARLDSSEFWGEREIASAPSSSASRIPPVILEQIAQVAARRDPASHVPGTPEAARCLEVADHARRAQALCDQAADWLEAKASGQDTSYAASGDDTAPAALREATRVLDRAIARLRTS